MEQRSFSEPQQLRVYPVSLKVHLTVLLFPWCPGATRRGLFNTFIEGRVTMEDAWFWNHVLGLSLSMVLLCAPGPVGASTPNNHTTEPATSDFYSSSSAQEDVETEGFSLFSESQSTAPRTRLHPLSSTAGQTGKSRYKEQVHLCHPEFMQNTITSKLKFKI